MARIELSAEVRAIESLIDAGEQGVASTRLQAAQPNLGRRPEYRYLICLYDAKFRVRSDTELLRDVTELVGEQPDLMEATALLAEIYARTGDEARADLFARLALESPSPSARSRALEVLKAHANDAPEPPSSHLRQVDPEPHESSGRLRAATEAAPQSSNLDAWFDRAGRERVHRRTPMYGVKASSIVEMLLAWGKSVAAGNSFISKDALPLTRDSLAVVDEAILALRRQPGQRNASKSDTSRATAAAGFFLAVVLNELEA
ncbi:MAG TPA: hypothetical protein VJT73_15025, partial [Polyangiaceae bacterium]|nr:hypothetical protein [Polyangiaceae bacterium]